MGSYNLGYKDLGLKSPRSTGSFLAAPAVRIIVLESNLRAAELEIPLCISISWQICGLLCMEYRLCTPNLA